MLRDKNLLLRYLFILGGIVFTLLSAREIPVERFFLLCLLYLLNAQLRVIALPGKWVWLSLAAEMVAVFFLWRQFGGMTNLLLLTTLYDTILLTGNGRYPLVLTIFGLQIYLLDGGRTEYLLVNLLLFLFTLLAGLRLSEMDRAVKDSEGLYDEVRRYSYELEDARKRLIEYAKKVAELAQIEERSHLSGEIHDTIGHQLTGILLQTEATLRVLPTDLDKGSQMLSSVRDNLRESIETLRRTVRNLKPAAAPAQASSLPDLAADFARRTGVRIDFCSTGRPYKLYPSAEIIFYKNAQEALTNAVRHGRAQNVQVILEYSPTATVLTVADDGPGCAQVAPGLGLKGMEERTKLADGELIIDGSGGFTVKTILPRRDEG